MLSTVTHISSLEIQAENVLRYREIKKVLGKKNHESLVSLKYAIAGINGSGSLILNSLARIGVTDISIIDINNGELHSIDTGDCLTRKDVQEYKAGAAVSNLRASLFPNDSNIYFKPVVSTLHYTRGKDACRESDIIICCDGDDFSRYTASFLGAAYLKPVLDISTHISCTENSINKISADIRLYLPGDACIQCMGAIKSQNNYSGISKDGTNNDENYNPNISLRSLNQIAAHIGVRMIEDYISGRITTSRWVMVEFDSNGKMEAQTFDGFKKQWNCLCQKKGKGDAVLCELDKDNWEMLVGIM